MRDPIAGQSSILPFTVCSNGFIIAELMNASILCAHSLRRPAKSPYLQYNSPNRAQLLNICTVM